jgi:hypothetical protein
MDAGGRATPGVVAEESVSEESEVRRQEPEENLAAVFDPVNNSV